MLLGPLVCVSSCSHVVLSRLSWLYSPSCKMSSLISPGTCPTNVFPTGMQVFLQLQEFLQFQNKFFDFLQFQKLELWIEDIEKWPVALFMHWNGVFWASRHTKIYKISGTTHLAPARTRWCRFAPVLSCKFILSYLHPCYLHLTYLHPPRKRKSQSS